VKQKGRTVEEDRWQRRINLRGISSLIAVALIMDADCGFQAPPVS
jgi:hypothetical protein